MDHCLKCQSEIDDGGCPKCGDDLQAKAAPAATEQGNVEQRFCLRLAYCPRCKNEINDRICPHCGYDLQVEIARRGKFKLQFGLPFLFFLMGLTAVACTISKAIESWQPAPLIFVNGLLFWRTRRDIYACLPGLVLGFAVGLLITHATPEYAVVFSLMFATACAGLNAQLRGYRASGTAAFIASAWYMLIMTLPLR